MKFQHTTVWLAAVLCFLYNGLKAQDIAKPDTLKVHLDHLHLEDVLILDQWQRGAAPADPHASSTELRLKELPGVNLISRGAYGKEVSYRGQSEGRVQVRINGMRIYNACTDRMDPVTSYVAENNLQSAELDDGCGTKCSANGLTGNLNLETRKGDFQGQSGWEGGVSQQMVTNGWGSQTAAHLTGHAKRWAWRVNGSWQKSGNYRDGSGREVKYSQFEKANLSGYLGFRASGRDLLELELIYDRATDVGYPALLMDVGLARGLIGSITYSAERPLGPFARQSWKIYHNDIYHQMDDSQRPEVAMRMDMPGWSRTSGFRLDATGWQEGAHQWTAGAEVFTNYRKAEMTMYPEDQLPMYMMTWPDARLYGAGVGLQHQWQWGEGQLNTSLRLDGEASHLAGDLGLRQWSGMGYEAGGQRVYWLPQWRSGYTLPTGENHQWLISAQWGKRAPVTSELYGFYLFNASDAFDYLGSPDLVAEQMAGTEVGHIYHQGAWRISTRAYWHQYLQYIFGQSLPYSAMTPGARGVRQYENLPSARVWGVEHTMDYRPDGPFHATARWEYVNGFAEAVGPLPLMPPLQGQVRGAYRWQEWHFSLQTRWAWEQKVINTAYGDRYTPGYALWDVALWFPMEGEQVDTRLEVSLENAFDMAYRPHLQWGEVLSPGRSLRLKVTFVF